MSKTTNTRTISLSGLDGTYEAIIDASDYDAVSAHKWNVAKIRNGLYVRSYTLGRQVNGRKSYVYLHRFILNAPDGKMVDHKNRNCLDNRRSNLRFATRSENAANSQSSNPHGYRGVFLDRGKWRACIRHKGAIFMLGTFTDVISAALAYDAAARTFHRDFATLNFPKFEITQINPSPKIANANALAMTLREAA